MNIGWMFFIAGVFSGAIHIIALLAIFKFRNVLVTPSIVPEIALILGDLTVGGLHPFSGSAAFCNRSVKPMSLRFFIDGFKGFQMDMGANWLSVVRGKRVSLWDISACGHPFHSFRPLRNRMQILVRYSSEQMRNLAVLLWNIWTFVENYRTYKCYVFVFFTLFFFVLFWAAMPLVGWGRWAKTYQIFIEPSQLSRGFSYAMTRVQIVCTIDWMKIDTPFVSYATAYTMCCFMAPLAVSCFCYKSIYEAYKNRRTKIDWAYEAHIGKVP